MSRIEKPQTVRRYPPAVRVPESTAGFPPKPKGFGVPETETPHHRLPKALGLVDDEVLEGYLYGLDFDLAFAF